MSAVMSKTVKTIKRGAVCVLLATLLLSLSACSSTGGGAPAGADPAAPDKYASYKDVPGVTKADVEAIEAIRSRVDKFVYGMINSSECFVKADGTLGGYGAFLCRWLSDFFGIPFELSMRDRESLRGEIIRGDVDFSSDYIPLDGETDRFITTLTFGERPIEYARSAVPGYTTGGRGRIVRYGFLSNSIAEVLTGPYIESNETGYARQIVGDHVDALNKLRSGELDVFISDSTIIGLYNIYPDIETGLFDPLLFKHVLICTADPSLAPVIDVLNKYLSSGGLADLHPLYMQGQTEFLRETFIRSLTPVEYGYYIDRISSGQPIPFSVSSDNYPIGFFDRNINKWAGISIDLLNEISRVTGLEFKPANDTDAIWEDTFGMLIRSEVPMTAELLYTPSREGRFIWADSAYTANRYVLVSSAYYENIRLNQISYAHIGTIKDTAYEDQFHEWFPEHAHVVQYDSVMDGMDAIERGEIDLVMLTEGRFLTVTNYLERSGFKINLIFNYETESKFGFNVGEATLRNIVSKAQALVDTEAISNFWNHRVFDYQIELSRTRSYYLLSTSVLLLCILALITVLFVRSRRAGKRLETLVGERTYELENRNTLLSETQNELETAAFVAQSANKAKTEFLANMSHEIRTPMNVIVGLTEILMDNDTPEDLFDGYIKSINTAGSTLVRLISDVLDISKIESGEVALAPTGYDTANLLYDVVMLNTARFESKNLAFKLKIADNVYKNLFGDDLRVKQIISNLLSNAFKYTREGTVTLSVSCEREGGVQREGGVLQEGRVLQEGEALQGGCVLLTLVVSDTGIGMRREDLEKIFNTYNQVDTRLNRAIEGTGLGLPITKRLVELMDGQISVESEYGKGSAFTVVVRQGYIDDEFIDSGTVDDLSNFKHEDDRAKTAGKLVRADLSWARVLVVDDSSMNLEVAKGLLGKYRMVVDCATNGPDAIERLREAKPVYDAIFMDYVIPGMDGIETARLIRALGTDYAVNIPIIALTANAIADSNKIFLENGFQAYLSKPISVVRLDEVVRLWISRRSAPLTAVAEEPRPGPGTDPGTGTIIDIPGLNAKRGLSIYEGDMELYLDILRAYVSTIPAEIEKLRHVAQQSLPDYAIGVHTIKGASRSVGARAISRRAEALEKLAKDGDLDGILNLNDGFLSDTGRLVQDISAWLERNA